MPLKITEFYAFIATEADGEGLCAAHTGMGWLPLVGADAARVDSLRELAQQTANASGRKLTLAKFSVREDLETILPKQGQP